MRQFRVLINGNEYRVAIEEIYEEEVPKTVDTDRPDPGAKPLPADPRVLEDKVQKKESGQVNSSMPGTVLDVLVAVGDRVEKGAVFLTLEAMKMENEVVAPHDGVVQEIYVDKGSSVNTGDPLILLS